MVVVGAAILPHGALPFDGDPQSDSPACRERHAKLSPRMKEQFAKLYSGMVRAGEEVARMYPDLVVLHTPHGISLTSSLGVYLNGVAAGSAMWNDCWDEFKVQVNLDSALADQLVTHFRSSGVACEGISAFSRTEMPLRWGEAIPIWYITRNCKKDVKFLVLTQSLKPSVLELSEVPEDKLHIGSTLFQFLNDLDLRVAVVISGDLSHTYQSDCTDSLYLPARSWNLHPCHESAVAMEEAFICWVKGCEANKDSPSSATVAPHAGNEKNKWKPEAAVKWLQKATTLQSKAYSCGLVGFMALHALLEGVCQSGQEVTSLFITCQAPTYYGMMAAAFHWEK